METLASWLGAETKTELVWIMTGLGGQLLFMMRFIVQMIVSEKAKKSIIPVSFWWISIAGAAILLSYAIYRADPVFILGQSLGFFIYARNLWLIHAEGKKDAEAEY